MTWQTAVGESKPPILYCRIGRPNGHLLTQGRSGVGITVTDRTPTDTDVQFVLQSVEQHLEEAERLLWTEANRTTDHETEAIATELTDEIWALQHSLEDAKHRLQDDREEGVEATAPQSG